MANAVIINTKQKKEDKMPGFDKTGPQGEGSMTGRRMGRCTNSNTAGSNSTRYGVGRNMKNGFRRNQNRNIQDMETNTNRSRTRIPKEEKEFLENNLEILKQEMAALEKKIENLNKKM